MQNPLAALLLVPLLIFGCAAFAEPEPRPGPGLESSPWERLVAHAADADPLTQRAARFLASYRPDRDATIDADLLIENLELAVVARAEFPWARSVPEALFFNDVLPYAVLDETRERWRLAMLERARPIVAGSTTATDAAQALNRELFTLINVHYNTGRKKPNQSPAESMGQGRATCTGLSILLVDACRAVGIPARVAGVASWHDKRGNHTWVEFWDDGWHFIGADEYDARGPNRGWFTGDAAKAIPGSEEYAVWASSYRATGSHFPMVWNRADTSVHAVDVTARYAPVSSVAATRAGSIVFVRAFESQGGERISVRVRRSGADQSVVTNAGTSDLNDMPSLMVPLDKPSVLEVVHAGHTRRMLLPASDARARTVEIVWNELGLSRAEAETMLADAFEARREVVADRYAAELEAGEFTTGDHTMRILECSFGDAPESGASLWISLHGGGGTTADVNDQQWQNQIRLYTPTEGVYIAPRAPTNTWNLWHQAHIDSLLGRLIEGFVAIRGIDPERVYLMGYSAGGDGVFQLAPRMADRFAAAAMMAGHPNETRPLGLRNLPFALLMGADDAAFDRNTKAIEWEARLAELQDADPEGYPHTVRVYEGLGHWMERRDAEILPWMAARVRDPWPGRVVWHQDDVTHDRFYWLAVDPGAAEPRSTIVGEVSGQTISITTPEHTAAVRVRLHDRLLDLDQPVRVVVNGVPLFEGLVSRTRNAIERSLEERFDRGTACFAELRLAW